VCGVVVWAGRAQGESAWTGRVCCPAALAAPCTQCSSPPCTPLLSCIAAAAPRLQVSDAGKLEAYNAVITHETLRVAVVDNVARPGSMHPSLRCVGGGGAMGSEGFRHGVGRTPAWAPTPHYRPLPSPLSLPTTPPPLLRREAMLPSFAALREEYAEAAGRHAHLDGRPLRDTLDGTNTGTFAFAALGARIAQLADAVDSGELT
jgi:hypothetical protein